MKLIINGIEKSVKSDNVFGLLKELNLKDEKIVIEINKNIIDKENFENTKLNNNDKVEIVTLVGGG